MNFNRFIKYLLLVFTLVIFSFSYGFAQEKNDTKEDKQSALRELIESRNFSFIAQSATPMAGRFINLTSLYDVKISGDTIMSDLPYFGRAFVAPINQTESALRFTSTDFNYNIKEQRKGGWEILTSPKDGKDVRQMQMFVSKNGTAALQVMSNNRQSISFSGYIKENKRR